MSPKSRGIKVPRRLGEDFRRSLIELGKLNREREIQSDDVHVYLPVGELNERSINTLRSIGKFELVDFDFQKKKTIPSLEDILGYRPRYEVIGDIAILDPDESEEVGSTLMAFHKNVRAVHSPASAVEGEFRIRRFRHIAGEMRTYTVHKEHGLRYSVDLEKAYFTPRLGTERLRVAQQVAPSNVVLDMFAGVGPFALLMAKSGAHVIAIEKNPAAVSYLKENASLNKIEDIEILEGDAAKLALSYENQADHVIMNLPHSASEFLIPAMTAAKKGGTIHYYSISPEEDLYGKDTTLIEDAGMQLGMEIEILYRGIVRSYAPRQYNTVIDFRVDKH
jgi:tRNA (guanine37-N1)-methyltransferase